MVSSEERGKTVLQVAAERNNLLQQRNDCKVSKTNLERKLFEQDVILKAMMAFLIQLKKLRLLENEE